MEADIAIVGAGPRGISITERIAAFLNDRGATPLTLHIIDDAQLGAGRIWDTEQTRTPVSYTHLTLPTTPYV